MPGMTAAEEAMPEPPLAAIPGNETGHDAGRADRMDEKKAGGNERSQGISGEFAEKQPIHEFSNAAEIQKTILLYEAKIKRIRMDIIALEMLKAVPANGEVSGDLPHHYQNYPAQKPPRQRS